MIVLTFNINTSQGVVQAKLSESGLAGMVANVRQHKVDNLMRGKTGTARRTQRRFLERHPELLDLETRE